MQAFRTAVTIDTDQELHLRGVPFRSGSVVEVIVLPAESDSASGDDAELRVNGSELARTQYQLAHQHPEDYAVLVGERVLFHSPDRKAAFGAFDRACADFPGAVPVIVEPDGKPRRPSRFRGRGWRFR